MWPPSFSLLGVASRIRCKRDGRGSGFMMTLASIFRTHDLAA